MMARSESNRASGGEERGMVGGEEGERESKPGYRRREYYTTGTRAKEEPAAEIPELCCGLPR